MVSDGLLEIVTRLVNNPFSLGFFATFAVNIVFVFIMIIRLRHWGKVAAWFLLLVIMNCIWAFSQCMISVMTTQTAYSFWYSLMELMLVVIMPLELWFVLTYVGKEKLLQSFGMLSFIFITSFTQIFFYWKTDITTLHDFRHVLRTPWGYQYPRGVFPVDLAVIILYVIIVIYQLTGYLSKEKNPDRRHQVFLIIIALLIPTVGGFVFQGILPIVLGVPEFPVTPLLSLFTCFIIAYALIRFGERAFSVSDALSELIHIIPGSIVILDTSYNIQSANTSFLNLVGKKEDEIIEKPFFTIVPDEPGNSSGNTKFLTSLQAVVPSLTWTR